MRTVMTEHRMGRQLLAVVLAVIVMLGMIIPAAIDPIYAASSKYKPYVGKKFKTYGGYPEYIIKLKSLSKKRIKGKIDVYVPDKNYKAVKMSVKFNKKIKVKNNKCTFTVKKNDGTKVKVKLHFTKGVDDNGPVAPAIQVKTSSKQNSLWNNRGFAFRAS